MITLTITNRKLYIDGADRNIIRHLEKITSYTVAGFMFAPSFRAHHWDGKEHLLKFSNKDGYHTPSGLLCDVIKELKKIGREYNLIDKTKIRNNKRVIVWNDSIVMRPYQDEVVSTITKKAPVGRGIIVMPIRSGKTKTAARIIFEFGRPTLLIVPSLMLLRQTIASLQEAFPEERIGAIGEGECDVQAITVATFQTLLRMRGRKAAHDNIYNSLLTSFDMVIVDEAHHIKGSGEWHHVLHDFDAKYKLALSATVFLNNKDEAERGIIWLKACCGSVRVRIDTSALINDGYLMKQNVLMFRVKRPDLSGRRWSQGLRVQAITQNQYRNKLIARLARRAVSSGMKVLIIANRFDQIAILSDMLDSEGVEHRTITGKHKGDEREDIIDGLVRGDYGVIIGTVLGEGIDIPSVECVINAEGGKDVKSSIQRQRNLTKTEGKIRAVFIDFMDETNEYFKSHSEERLASYRSESAFSVRVIGS